MAVGFPKTIYVTKHKEIDSEWLTVNHSENDAIDVVFDDSSAASKVAIYELKVVKMARIIKMLVPVLLAVLLVGCTSPYILHDTDIAKFGVTPPAEGKKKMVVTGDTEVRSLFGTNGGGDVFELCDGPEKTMMFYTRADFNKCEILVHTHPLRLAFDHKQSRGAGPEIVGAAIVGGSIGVGAALSGGGAAANATANATSRATMQSIPRLHLPGGNLPRNN